MNRRSFLAQSSALMAGGALSALRLPGAVAGQTQSGDALVPEFFSRFPRCTDFEPKVPIVRIASGRTIHRFFDTCPISPSGRYVGLFRLPNEVRPPQPGETGEVVLVDLKTGTERVVAETRGWETQMGANVQWGATDADLFFNDVDSGTWKPFAVQLDPISGNKRTLDGTVFTVSPDGKFLTSYNLVSSRRIQVG